MCAAPRALPRGPGEADRRDDDAEFEGPERAFRAMARSGMAPIDSPEILLLEPDRSAVVVASIQNVMVQVWHGEATAHMVRRIRAHMEAMCETYPDGFALIHVFYASAPAFPSRDVLAEIKAMAKMKFAPLRAQAAVIEYQSFAAAALRAFLTTARRVNAPMGGPQHFRVRRGSGRLGVHRARPCHGQSTH